MIKVEISTIDEEFEKAQVKGFIRTRHGKMERVNPYARQATEKQWAHEKMRIRNAFGKNWGKNSPGSQKLVIRIERITSPKKLANFADALEDENVHDLAGIARAKLLGMGYDSNGKKLTSGLTSGESKQEFNRRLLTPMEQSINIVSIDEELEKSRTKGAKDKKKRKHKQKESAFVPKEPSGSITQSSDRWLDRYRDYLD
jgi:hypothetical protein